jgi:two-component system, cell cycle response regulator
MNQEPILTSKRDILIVDDTPANLRLLTRILSGEGYEVRVASSGKQALRSVESKPPSLIILDIMMPEIDGYQVCQQLKAKEETCDIPVIFLSALDEVMNKVKAFELGGVDYMTKPFEPIEVVARVHNQLRLRELQLQLQEKNVELQLLLTVTQAINEASDVDTALNVILEEVCQTLGWDFGEAWIPNAEETILQSNVSWYREDDNLVYFYHNQHLSFPFNEGLPGRVWQSQKLEIIENFEAYYPINTSRFDRESLSLKSALAVPILFANKNLAVLMFYSKTAKILDQRSQDILKAIATQLGSMIQRKQAEELLKQANQELERLATFDWLTQIPNRRCFDEYLFQEWRRLAREQQSLSLILCDVDYFKLYNDHYGHQEGDDCLQQVAQALRRAVRRPADLVARYGGEEFAVILPNTEGQNAVIVAERIREEIKKLKIIHAYSNVSEYVTLSLGVSCLIPTQSYSPEPLVSFADQALYEAKKQGRDRVISFERKTGEIIDKIIGLSGKKREDSSNDF